VEEGPFKPRYGRPPPTGNDEVKPSSSARPENKSPSGQYTPRSAAASSRGPSASDTKPVEENTHNSQTSLPQSTSDVPFVAKPKGGTDFTEEETNELKGLYNDIVNIDENRMIDAWTTYAAKVSS
jgi:hypothetical protein